MSATTKLERRVIRAAKQIVAVFPAEKLECARSNRKLVPGSGGQWFITNALLVDLVEAVVALAASEPTDTTATSPKSPPSSAAPPHPVEEKRQ